MSAQPIGLLECKQPAPQALKTGGEALSSWNESPNPEGLWADILRVAWTHCLFYSNRIVNSIGLGGAYTGKEFRKSCPENKYIFSGELP